MGTDVRTCSARSTAALSSTGAANWIVIGAATPTSRSSPMFSVARTVWPGATVVNEPVTGELLPPGPVAVPPQV